MNSDIYIYEGNSETNLRLVTVRVVGALARHLCIHALSRSVGNRRHQAVVE